MNQNIQERQARLVEAQKRAKKLMQLEANGTLDKIAKAKADGINESLSTDGSVTTQSMMTTNRDRLQQAPMMGGRMSVAANNVPQAIREAFMANPIDDSALYSAFGDAGDGRSLSFLTEGLEQPQQQQVVQQPNVRQIVSEGLGVQQPQMQVPQQIDYPMIRTIVEEIVRKYAVSLNKKIISEGKQTPNEISTIALGKTFKFLDNDGNIYECTMKKVGNLNKNKKSVNG